MGYLVVLLFIILLSIGVPIAFVIGWTNVIYAGSMGNWDLLISFPHRMMTGLQNYSLLAIPLFILVGELMNYGGVTNRLVKFAQVLVGHFRGGLAYVNVFANMFLASIMGSANAQTAMMSRVMVPEMEKNSYNKEFSAALTASSSLIGPIIPPSLVFIIYAVVAEVSVASMFLAGIIPGILLTGAFVLYLMLISKKQNFPKDERAPVAEMTKSAFVVLPALSIPIIIIVGILTGAFTATESAAVACFLAFLVGMFLYKELKIKDLPQILLNTVKNTSIVTFIIAMTTVFGYLLSFERVPALVADLMTSITESPYVFLLLCVIFFFLIGMFLDGIAAMIFIVPVLLPVALAYGIDPIHFGIIMSINMTIGLITPPVGTALFITASITKSKFENLVRQVFPFIIVATVILLIIVYVPTLTTWLPSLSG